MTLNDAYNVVETIEILSIVGIKKAKQRFDHLLIKSFLAGVLLSFGGLFLLIVGGGSAPLAENLGSRNEIGCLFFQYLLVHHADLLSNEPYGSFTIKFGEIKGNIEWYEMFLRCIGIYLPIWLFIGVGYKHSIANMFTVQMSMLLGRNLSIEKYILRIVISVTLGNILGGTFFVGFIYSYQFIEKNKQTISSLRNLNDHYDKIE